MVDTPKHIRKLNEILRRELGERERRYSWQWSEDLILGAFSGWKDSGVMTAGGMRIPVALYTPTKMRYGKQVLDQQWVLCEMTAPVSESEWKAKNGWLLEWPSKGYWRPIGDGLRAHCLPRGMDPDEDCTSDLIYLVRQSRPKTVVDHRIEIEDGIDKRDADKRKRNREMVRDKIPAFAGGKPGGKQHWAQGGLNLNLHERKGSNGSGDTVN